MWNSYINRCLLFNLALEKVVRDYNISVRGNVYNKSIQLLGFADDIDIIARTPAALRQAFLSLEKEALKMGEGVKINVALFSYMRAFGDGLVVFNHSQATMATPELAPPPNYHTNEPSGWN
ncbi:hypothetical protein TNCV_1605731 [Trichonephila clavipes]|nr:hypothetical protein TNCV_1605731 [Trichonephila clavipes]